MLNMAKGMKKKILSIFLKYKNHFLSVHLKWNGNVSSVNIMLWAIVPISSRQFFSVTFAINIQFYNIAL